MNFFLKLTDKNDRKHDLILSGLYFLLMFAALGIAILLILFEPGRLSPAIIEDLIYIIKITLAAALCFFALYCFIRMCASLITGIRRK